MTLFNFSALLWLMVVIYTIGDNIAGRGIISGKTDMHRIGCVLVAAALSGIAILGVILLCAIRR